MTQVETCTLCGSELHWEKCWYCAGTGSDATAYAQDAFGPDPPEWLGRCPHCHGEKGYYTCPTPKKHTTPTYRQLDQAQS